MVTRRLRGRPAIFAGCTDAFACGRAAATKEAAMTYAFGSKGRYWNVGMSEPGRLPATSRQLRALWYLSDRKVDYRSKGLTRDDASRSEEHTSEIQSLMRISYAGFCL